MLSDDRTFMQTNPSAGASTQAINPPSGGGGVAADQPSRGRTMATPKTYQINGFSLEQVRNRNELRVVEFLRQELPNKAGFCGCRICVEDAYAAAMNSMSPQYAQIGSIILRKHPTEDEVRDTVVKAIERVHSHPKHATEPPPLTP
jgi:hypothetical protein